MSVQSSILFPINLNDHENKIDEKNQTVCQKALSPLLANITHCREQIQHQNVCLYFTFTLKNETASKY